MTNLITIDLNLIAAELRQREDWSDALLDILEDKYNLETELVKLCENHPIVKITNPK